MTELSGLELRKALCEALGYAVLEKDGLYTCAHDGKQIGNYWWVSAEQIWPAFESDPAAFWPEFEKWLRHVNITSQRQIYAGMQVYLDGSAQFQILHNDDGTELANTPGASICEAGSRAWLAALRLISTPHASPTR